MDNYDELDEPVISSSGRKIKIKAETFSWNPAKAARYNGEEKALCIYITYTLSSEEIKRMFLFNSETWNVELSAFAIKQTFNI